MCEHWAVFYKVQFHFDYRIFIEIILIKTYLDKLPDAWFIWNHKFIDKRPNFYRRKMLSKQTGLNECNSCWNRNFYGKINLLTWVQNSSNELWTKRNTNDSAYLCRKDCAMPKLFGILLLFVDKIVIILIYIFKYIHKYNVCLLFHNAK